MNAIYDYIFASFTASLIAGIGERITPGGMKKYVTFIASLILLIYLFTPIKSLGEEVFRFADGMIDQEIQESPSVDAYDEVLTLTRKKTEEAILKHLFERFGMQDQVHVSLRMEMQEDRTIIMTQITLKLSCRDMQFAEEIEAYLEKSFHTETTIIQSTEE